MTTNGDFLRGDIDEGRPPLPQHHAGDTLPPEEHAELLAIRKAKRADAEAAAERARTGNHGGVY